jgi:putative DNA primase/helicase
VPDIVAGLPVVKTPSGGWHVFYRCQEIGGNSKIAIDPSREKKTLIETRGQGGYVVAVGSPPGAHKLGQYVQHSGPALPTIPEITPEQRRELFKAARTFDKRSQAARQQLIRKYQPRPIVSNGRTHPVVESFNQRHSWQDILSPAGWRSHDGVNWTRPGKSSGNSAKMVHGADGSELLTVFSGNAGPLSPNGSHRTFSKFVAWGLLAHQGDYSAAFRAAKQEAES